MRRAVAIAVGRSEVKKRRFFRLFDTAFAYYKDDRVKEMKKLIHLSEISRVDKDYSHDDNLSFLVETRERTYRLAASHVTDRNSWIDALKKAVRALRQKQKTGVGEGLFERSGVVSPTNSVRLDAPPVASRPRTHSNARPMATRVETNPTKAAAVHTDDNRATTTSSSAVSIQKNAPPRVIKSSVSIQNYHQDMISSLQKLEWNLGDDGLQTRFLRIHRPIVSAIFIHGVVMNVALPVASVSSTAQSSFKQRRIYCSDTLEWLIFSKVHADNSTDDSDTRDRRASISSKHGPKTKAKLSVRDIIRVDVDAADDGADDNDGDHVTTPSDRGSSTNHESRFHLFSQVRYFFMSAVRIFFDQLFQCGA